MRDKDGARAAMARLRGENRRLRAELDAMRAQKAELLERAEEELRLLVSATNHDLRAPLRHIELFGQILIDDHAAQLPPAAVEGLGHLHGSAHKLRLDALTSMMRQTSGELVWETVELGALVTSRCAQIAAQRAGRAVALGPAPTCWAEVDRRLMEMAIDALLHNAWHFMQAEESPTLTLTLEHDGAGLGLAIRDNGIGFEQRHASRLGTPCRKLHTNAGDGAGLGLALAMRVLRRHEGSLTLTGEVGSGATALLRLPTLRTRR